MPGHWGIGPYLGSGGSDSTIGTGIHVFADDVDLDLTTQRLTVEKITVAKSHPAEAVFTVMQAEYTLPINYYTFIQIVDYTYDDITNPVFEGHVAEIEPAASNEIRYTCYDPCWRSAKEVYLFDAPYQSGGDPATSGVPRVLWNAKIDTDDDAAFQRRTDATMSEIMSDIFTDTNPPLRLRKAAPDSGFGPPYEASDVSGWDWKPQEKIVFESATIREALDQILQWYPKYMLVFEPGNQRRRWRFRDQTAGTSVTLQLNDPLQSYPVLTKALRRTLDRRMAAVKIYGPPNRVNADVSTSGGGLTQYAAATISTGQGDQSIGYAWQVSDSTKRRMARILPSAVTLGAWIALREVSLFVTYDGSNYYIVPDCSLDILNGIVRAPTAVYKEPTNPDAYKTVPTNVRLIYAYYDTPLTVRYPTSGFSGTANSVAGCQAILHRYDESLAIGYENGTPVSSSERTTQMTKLATSMQEAYRDLVYTGGFTLAGIDYSHLRLNERINVTSLNANGGALTTGMEAINAVLTDVEYDYVNQLTTLQINSDALEYLMHDPEQLKRWLKIEASWYYNQTGPLFTIDVGGYAFGTYLGFGDTDSVNPNNINPLTGQPTPYQQQLQNYGYGGSQGQSNGNPYLNDQGQQVINPDTGNPYQ